MKRIIVFCIVLILFGCNTLEKAPLKGLNFNASQKKLYIKNKNGKKIYLKLSGTTNASNVLVTICNNKKILKQYRVKIEKGKFNSDLYIEKISNRVLNKYTVKKQIRFYEMFENNNIRILFKLFYNGKNVVGRFENSKIIYN